MDIMSSSSTVVVLLSEFEFAFRSFQLCFLKSEYLAHDFQGFETIAVSVQYTMTYTWYIISHMAIKSASISTIAINLACSME